ncbi:LPS export ABC transporter periplasmic protein LptC [Mangrovimonas sp. YM274]|uniref:LPS export ABC transporter periplasmic protein LptC n=1 Tax=Mangrovimonas sp. YM274 TaxID=3070660 RepID=UPI0027DE6745|nr:LPS export ABC transporter periplasmic protein LptC [Mangrovimonas sp. YM274]WMI68500.1 LPS export ABC transporter periplasmic protein LptC [Mangrovimonas sp. YM274]
MKQKHLYNTIKLVTAFAVTLFFSCQNNLKEVQKIGISQNKPIGEAEHINLKYTEKLSDTAKMKANLISPKMWDYSNRKFSFTEFPEGIYLTVYDDDYNKNVIVSDYAIVYNETDLIDLQGNVVLSTYSKDTLYADQLYYDQKNEWLFTNGKFTLRSGSEVTKGSGLDSDSNFENFEITEMSGVLYLDETEESPSN